MGLKCIVFSLPFDIGLFNFESDLCLQNCGIIFFIIIIFNNIFGASPILNEFVFK